MKSKKISTLNANPKAGDSLLVKAKQYNEVIEDVEFLFPKVNQAFTGRVDLSRPYTHYATFTVSSALEVGILGDPSIGGSAEIRLIGDGVVTPTFNAALTASAGSDAYDPTLAAINKVVFYYDGTTAFYSITVL